MPPELGVRTTPRRGFSTPPGRETGRTLPTRHPMLLRSGDFPPPNSLLLQRECSRPLATEATAASNKASSPMTHTNVRYSNSLSSSISRSIMMRNQPKAQYHTYERNQNLLSPRLAFRRPPSSHSACRNSRYLVYGGKSDSGKTPGSNVFYYSQNHDNNHDGGYWWRCSINPSLCCRSISRLVLSGWILAIHHWGRDEHNPSVNRVSIGFHSRGVLLFLVALFSCVSLPRLISPVVFNTV
ncbi:hypothetical protein EX30DRAFT_397299 [Ascodesmis nigricans]|uniref:Uncharacterized protein n=1 Tax=Ascodesmis nigricans TaxID=341454 RepID=A0A4S2MPM5_9PEZI|nr:hypothetical protein EX30DRAFT_397299 [Ascodesmis nigricans]